jgi:hypothetical protein
MRRGEMADLLAKWLEEESLLSCKGSFDEFSFLMRCRVSSLSEESFTLTSEHGDCSLSIGLGIPEVQISYAEPREMSAALGLTLTLEQDLSSMISILFHPESFPKDSSKPRDKLLLVEVVE